MKIIGKMLGVLLIFLAFYYFDRHDLQQMIVSFLLFSSGFTSLTGDSESEFLQKAAQIIRRVSLVLAVILIIKFLFYR